MIRLLAALLALILPALAGAQVLYPPFLLTQNVDDPDDYVSLAASETFGPGGTIFDLTDRVAPPRYLGPPSENPADYATVISTFRNASCSSDDSTWIAFRAALLAASDSTFIWLPQNCHMKIWMVAAGDGSMAAIANTKDDIQVHCADPALCSVEIVYYPDGQGPAYVGGGVSTMETRSEPGDGIFAIGDGPARRVFDIGTGPPATVQDCDWDPTYTAGFEFGTHVVKLNPSDCLVTSTGATAWGPGDIARLRTDRITGYGTRGWTWLGRVACVRTVGADGIANDATAPDGVLFPNDSALCDGLTMDNAVRFLDPVPWDLRPDTFYWGDPALGLGDFFFRYLGSSNPDTTGPSIYAPTSGHKIQQVERAGTGRCDIVKDGVCGNGATTDNIAENIWFTGLAWTVTPQYVGGMIADFRGVYGGGFFRGGPLNDSGRTAVMNFGGAGREVGAAQIHSMDWHGTAGNMKCFGEITEIWVDALDVVRFKVAANGNTDCYFETAPGTSQPNWGEPEVGFSDNVADPRLAGQRFIVTRETWNPCPTTPPATTCNAGTIGTWTMRINGLSGANPDGTGVPLDTTPGGIASNVDQYGGGSFYWNPYSSGIRVVNTFFKEPMQHALNQGCTGCVYSANYVHSNPAVSRRGRGPFNHGTGGSCGNIWENSASDQPIILADTSNREPVDHGEGCQNTYYKLRFYDSGPRQWPLGAAIGTDYGSATVSGSGGMFHLDNGGTSQNGAANDKWSLLLSSGKLASHNATDWDKADNYDGDQGAPPQLPYQFFRLANLRNRVSTGNDLDAWMDPLNTSTIKDTLANENGESTTVPAAWGPGGSNEIGKEPSALYLPHDAEFICPGSDPFSIGAYYDTIGGVNAKLPAEMRYLGEPCPVRN